jgi:hypothetical protein
MIIQDFMARLTDITIAHGYNTDCGATVLRVRKMVDPNKLPAIVIWPLPEKAEAEYGLLNCTMSIRIEGIAQFGATNPSVVAEKILGDFKKCILAPENLLASPDEGWSRSPDYIDGIVYTGGGTDDYPEESMLSVGASATFDVTYHTKLNDPYTQ